MSLGPGTVAHTLQYVSGVALVTDTGEITSEK